MRWQPPASTRQRPCVVTDEDAGDVLDNVVGLLAEHRVWDRFTAR
jgi:hypothetical protein